VATFERLPHGPDIADALEAIIGAAFGQVNEVGDEITLDFSRVDKVSEPEFPGERLLFGLRSTRRSCRRDHAAALDDMSPIPPRPKMTTLARLDLGRVDHRADAGRDTAPDVADFVEGRVLAYLRHGDFGPYLDLFEL